MSNKIKVSPSILASNFSMLGEEVEHISKAGADYIKFQIYNADEIATSKLKKAAYQKKNSINKNENQK